MKQANQSTVFHPGFGDKLRHAREALGLSTTDVAAKLKLGSRQIEALESEQLENLPDEVFVRGFVRNYARLLELEPEHLIVPVDIHAAVSETITAPSEGVIFSSPGLRRWVLLPLLALSLFVMLVAALYYWLRQGEDTLVKVPVEPPPPVALPVPAAPIVPPAPVPAEAPAAAEGPVAPADLAPVTPPIGSALPTPPAAVAAAPAPSAAPQAKPALPPAAPATPATLAPAPIAKPAALPATPPSETNPYLPASGNHHTLRFAPTVDAWIQVVDGQGKRYSKLVKAGTAEGFSGEVPFKVVVGEAAQVKFSYDGHVIDLAPFIGQKVARLTLE